MKAIPAALAAAILLLGCEREQREFRSHPLPADEPRSVPLSALRPGAAPSAELSTATARQYEHNAYHVSQGRRYFIWFNCNGCHGMGGGGSGPALMDNHWIYGGAPEQIFATIRDGRPNGMPSFNGKIPDQQIWQLVAYVRSMGRHVPKAAAPGRTDDLYPHQSEQATPRASPADAEQRPATPPATQQPQ